MHSKDRFRIDTKAHKVISQKETPSVIAMALSMLKKKK